jgi:thioredoxin reductase (NADPH)
MSTSPPLRQVIIIGGGPAGLTAALYTARAGLSPLLFEGYELAGGQLTTTTEVENFPGFPHGIDGTELMRAMREQACRFDAEVIKDKVTRVDFSQRPFQLWVEDDHYTARTVIIATGASPRRLGLPSEQRFWGRNPGGVSACATCDGAFYKGHHVAVIGGGDSAVEEATFLTRFADRVYLIHRRDALRASHVMQERARRDPKLTLVWDSTVDEVLGDDRQGVTALRLRSTRDDSLSELAVTGMFLAIGHIPQTALFAGQLALDEEGYLVVDEQQRTSVPGVFAAGDVYDRRYRQAITAAGSGCAAALEAQHALAE